MKSKMAVVGLLAMAAMLALAGSSMADVVIYQDTFTGTPGSTINGTTPDTRLGLYGGSAAATWTASSAIVFNGGTNAIFGSNLAYLPFSPQTNQVYTLTMNADFLGDWGAIGFTTSATPNTSQNMHSAGENNARVEYKAAVITLWANGGPTAYTASPGGSYNIVGVVLDTRTSGHWTLQGTLNGSLYGSTVDLGSPTIRGVAMSGGYSANNMNTASFSLTTSIPEPGSLTLLGLMGGALLLRRKLRRT